MDKLDLLKSMTTNLIKDKPEEASLDFHNYLTDKMREVAGLKAQAAEVQTEVDETAINLENDEQA